MSKALSRMLLDEEIMTYWYTGTYHMLHRFQVLICHEGYSKLSIGLVTVWNGMMKINS